MAGIQAVADEGATWRGAEPASLAPRDVHPIQSPLSWPAAVSHYDVMIVGANLSGAVMAERLATDTGRTVLVVDGRDDLGGDASEPVIAMIERKLDHPGIELLLGIDWREARACYGHEHLIFAGARDRSIVLPWPRDALGNHPHVTVLDAPEAVRQEDVELTVARALATFQRQFGEAGPRADDHDEIATAA